MKIESLEDDIQYNINRIKNLKNELKVAKEETKKCKIQE